jgi:hypothetical protein
LSMGCRVLQVKDKVVVSSLQNNLV